ncbi:hypothetical protein JW710_00370 [Candidatus Dojkabacteria bacterium]|nr:hypothetical protein [Candidatus Dojkabacteria bacterium]
MTAEQDASKQNISSQQPAVGTGGSSVGSVASAGVAVPPQSPEKTKGAIEKLVGKDKSPKLKKKREIIKSEEPEENLSKKLGQYLVPIMGVIVFMLLLMFVYIPYGSEALKTRQESLSILDEAARNNDKAAVLQGINLEELDENLSIVSRVVLDEMDVSELASEVERIAISNNLKSKELSLSDIMGGRGMEFVSDETSVPSFAESISGPFSFYGEFDDVVRFLEELREESPTTLFYDAVNLTIYSVDEETSKVLWSVDINIYGYTTQPVTKANISDPIKTGFDSDLFDEIKERANIGKSVDDESSEEEEQTPEEETNDESSQDEVEEFIRDLEESQ